MFRQKWAPHPLTINTAAGGRKTARTYRIMLAFRLVSLAQSLARLIERDGPRKSESNGAMGRDTYQCNHCSMQISLASSVCLKIVAVEKG